MNLILLEPALVADGAVRLDDRRAVHLRSVLGVAVGSIVRVGLVGGGVGEGTVTALPDDGAVELAVRCDQPAPPRLPVVLVLAVPRPKVLTRVIEIAAAFAVERIELVNAWRVDKAYLDSPRLAPDALAHAVRLGAEQGVSTHLPPVTVHRRLMAWLDRDHPAGVAPSAPALCAHPRQAAFLEDAAPFAGAPKGPVTLAIGPEGGWIEREVETFAARGFAVVGLGQAVLRVEAAVAASLGQLALLARR
jgi:16S rRNA (uracil1498-N3)-methyltransferase